MPELLIVGGLTIDRFADGSTAPGGSVLHAGRAAVADGVRPTFLTVAGDEPEAREGLASLAALGELHHTSELATTRYRHEQDGARRVLVYEAAGGHLDVEEVAAAPSADVLLLAPIADELPAASVDVLRATTRPRLTVLLIQGWLRRLAVDEPVRPVAMDEVDAATWRTFSSADAIVVSTEDLAEVPGDPFTQAMALRARLGPQPLVVLTLGSEGYLIDDPQADRIVAAVPRRVINGVPAVGAGDTFGAVLAIRLARGDSPRRAARTGTDRVIALLESRRT